VKFIVIERIAVQKLVVEKAGRLCRNGAATKNILKETPKRSQSKKFNQNKFCLIRTKKRVQTPPSRNVGWGKK